MYLLSIECTTRQTGIAILKDKQILGKKIWMSKDAGREILPAIDKLIKKVHVLPGDFDYFIISSGPGSWTGIRLGLALAYGLATANERKVFGISSIDAIAYSIAGKGPVGVFLPSIGKSVHCGFFEEPEQLSKQHGFFSTCCVDNITLMLKNAKIVAGPDEKILSLFKDSGKILVNIFPNPVLNAILALERIKNSVSPLNQPYYEK
ncbi:MAG: tRNA threonylcarbamoyladenosine biosynthesis protein TsaB [candidate division TA06 bacterium ADurb.Bin131]|uniref:tRNA threonylcarbamoyladenosine biosynthesis protein TsaB n=1 Tax=candidate division TA06 bacterium ADurb.Bin131 TaxID=1852827 RepID=A0A1V6C9Q3_UNCT6|nr:MAG: tRNA threonylcarbamoyladenosine biosynthesis protein TsaB [candidate division TA06 bacterium ADurb.Bin131]